MLRLQFLAYGPTTGRRGRYGDDGFDRRHLLLARAIGLLPPAVGIYLVARPWL